MQICQISRHKIEDGHDTKRPESQGRRNHSSQVRMVLKRISDFSWGCSSGEFSNHACGVTGRPHGRNQGEKTGKHTATSQFWQGAHHRKVEIRSTKSTSGITSQRQWQSFQDAHRSSLEESSTGTPRQTMQRSGGTTLARRSRTMGRTSAKIVLPRSSGAQQRGPRGRCRQTQAEKEALGVNRTPSHIVRATHMTSELCLK